MEVSMGTSTARPPKSRIHQAQLPAGARALCTLRRVDYEDAFRVEEPGLPATGEGAARAILENARKRTRVQLVAGWLALGLRLRTPGSTDTVLGWPIVARAPEYVVLSADGRLGLSGQLLFLREHDTLWTATWVAQHGPFARVAWARIEARHRHVVESLLRGACRRAASDRHPVSLSARRLPTALDPPTPRR
jgi:hypothetical protein